MIKNIKYKKEIIMKKLPKMYKNEETVFKEIAFGYKNFFPEASEKETETAVLAAADAVGLPREILSSSPFELSGGQKRRVAIAGVIVSKPEILILDEPVAGLDPVGKTELMRLLHALHGETCKTIIIVSHDMDEVAENCNKVAVFNGGKIVMAGSCGEVFSRAEELAKMRLDVPLTAFLTAKLKDAGYELENDFTTDDFLDKFVKLYKNA